MTKSLEERASILEEQMKSTIDIRKKMETQYVIFDDKLDSISDRLTRIEQKLEDKEREQDRSLAVWAFIITTINIVLHFVWRY